MSYTAAVVILSDRAANGERADETGPVLKEMLEISGYEISEYVVIPDEGEVLEKVLLELSDRGISLVLTSGGTGFSERDITPEVTKRVIERSTPGITEYMRMKSSQITDRAMLSRGAAGIRKGTLIVNLPGSPKAARENFSFISETIKHGIKILRRDIGDCLED